MRKRWSRKLRRWFRDPPLDLLGAGIVASFAGRAAVLGSLALGALHMGLYWAGVSLFGLMAFDALLQFEVLASLRRLMAYEIVSEIT